MPDIQSNSRFFIDTSLNDGAPIHLNEAQSTQVRKVLRLKPGDQVIVFDGSGYEGVGRIVAFGRGDVQIELVGEPYSGIVPGPPMVELGVAMIKGDRFDLIIQKATELGVARIVPIETERCVVSLPADRVPSRLARWRRIATEALEQSGRADAVEVTEPADFERLLEQVDSDLRLIAWERESSHSLASRVNPSIRSITVLIGPEGGFTENEVRAAGEAGFDAVGLGPTILRSETAAIAVPAMIRAAMDLAMTNRE